MEHNYTFEGVNDALPRLLHDLRANGKVVTSRAGRVTEFRHVGITLLDPLQREVLLPARGAKLVAQIAETAWMLAGRDDVGWLSNYLPRAADYSDDGTTWRGAYGPRLRNWHRRGTALTDQLAEVVRLLREDPSTRRAAAVIFDPARDFEAGKDIPCNNWLSFSARDGILDLHVAVRSNDVMWGWSGINVFEWSVLLEIVAGMTENEVGSLHFSTTSLHLYERHWDKAKKIVDESAMTEPWQAGPSPRYDRQWAGASVSQFDDLLDRWFRLEYDIRTHSPLVQGYIDAFPEPMLKSWLQVLDWWWNGSHGTLPEGTAIGVAARLGPKPPWHNPTDVTGTPFGGRSASHDPQPMSVFLDAAIRLHNEKHAAYGDSWKRRGEYMILANIARKVDRLSGGKETSDETQADTAMDLMIYLAKYRTWLDDQIEDRDNRPHPDSPAGRALGAHSDDPQFANELLVETEKDQSQRYPVFQPGSYRPPLEFTVETLVGMIVDSFDKMEKNFHAGEPSPVKATRVDKMLEQAYRLARHRWEAAEQHRVARETGTEDYLGADHD